MTARRKLTRLQRVRVFDAAHGICGLCKTRITVGEAWEVEHTRPLSMGGLDDESNMLPAHVDCHKRKSADEAPARAKADRVRAVHLGIKKNVTRALPCGRQSPFKKKMNGEVVRR